MTTETLINLCLLSGAGLAFIALIASLERMSERTRRKVMAALTMTGLASEWLHGEGCGHD